MAVLCSSILISLIQLSLRTIGEQSPGAQMGLHTLAYQFIPLQNIFKNIPRAGYYTDKNLEHPLAIAQYEQAQYVLAPTVLELGNTQLPLIIVDCTTPQIALEKIKKLKLTPISASPSGIILAVNPKFLDAMNGVSTGMEKHEPI